MVLVPYHYGLGLLACVTVAVLLIALVTSPPKLISLLLEVPVLVGIGRISYGLYLWHFPVFYGVFTPERAARWGIASGDLRLVRGRLKFDAPGDHVVGIRARHQLACDCAASSGTPRAYERAGDRRRGDPAEASPADAARSFCGYRAWLGIMSMLKLSLPG